MNAPRTARWLARTIVILGVALFVVGVGRDDRPWPGDLCRAGLVVMALGCWSLTILSSVWRPVGWEQAVDVVMALACLVVGLMSLYGATDEGGSYPFVEILGILLAVGGVMSIVVNAAAKNSAGRWRNTGEN